MRFLIMFKTAVCLLFFLKLKWPKKKSKRVFTCVYYSLNSKTRSLFPRGDLKERKQKLKNQLGLLAAGCAPHVRDTLVFSPFVQSRSAHEREYTAVLAGQVKWVDHEEVARLRHFVKLSCLFVYSP